MRAYTKQDGQKGDRTKAERNLVEEGCACPSHAKCLVLFIAAVGYARREFSAFIIPVDDFATV